MRHPSFRPRQVTRLIKCSTFRFLAKMLKNVLRDPRPIPTSSPITDFNPSAIPSSPSYPSHLDRRLKAQVKINREKTFGMPSTHSTSISFFMSYIVMALYSYPSTAPSFVQMHRNVLACGTMVWGVAILASRVYLGYHTVPQVVVGAILGSSSGIVWRKVWKSLIRRKSEKLAQKAIDEAFRYLNM